MSKFNIEFALRASVASASLVVCGAAYAQTGSEPVAPAPEAGASSGLEEIVVTAQRRSENLQKVPISVSAFTGTALRDANIRDAADLSLVTPGLSIQRGDRNLTPFLRGVGSDVNVVGFESSVAVYVDNIYYPRLSGGFLSLANVDRIEVLKGPQGTLFGRNASGGLVNIITSDPSLTNSEMRVSLGYGNYDTVNASGYVSVPLAENLAANLSISRTYQGDGWGRNVVTGNKTNYFNEFIVRGKLRFAPSDRTDLVLTGYYVSPKSSVQGNRYRGTTQGYQSQPYGQTPIVGFYDQNANIDGAAWTKGYGASLKATLEMDFATLSSISSYQHIIERSILDPDYSERNDFIYSAHSKIETVSQELQLSSAQGGSFNWTAGLYYFRSVADYSPGKLTGPIFAPLDEYLIVGRQNSQSYAAYAQATINLTDALAATLGGRVSHDDVRGSGAQLGVIGGASFPIAPFDRARTKQTRGSFRAALNYEIAPTAMVYASFNRGYKGATFGILPFNPAPVKAEVLDAAEIGFKSELFDRRLRLNGAAFYYWIKNPQFQSIQNSAALVDNAGSARVKGIELQADAALGGGLSLRGGVTYLDPKYKDFTNAVIYANNPNPPFGTQTPQPFDASGTRMLHASKWQANVGVVYEASVAGRKLRTSVDYSYLSNFFWNPDHVIRQDGYGLLSARMGYSINDSLTVSIWGKNLTDKKYYALGQESNGFAGYPYIPGAPRTYGGTIDFSF